MKTAIKLALSNQRGVARWVFILGTLVITAVGGLFALNSASQVEESSTERRLVVASQSVELLPGYYVDRFFSAQVQAQQSVAVASEIAGKITQVLVDEGDRVAKGDLLFSLDTLILEQQLSALQAQQESVKSERALAKKRLKRQQDLNQKSFSSEDTIDALAAQIDILSASLDSLKAQTEDINIRLNKSCIQAPFAGQIQKRLIDKGAVINAGTTALELIGNNQLEIQVGLPVSQAKTIELNKPYQFVANGNQVEATALSVLPKIDPVTQTQGVKFVVEEGALLVPGDYIRLVLPSYQQANGFWLANSALIEGERGLWQIFVIDDEGRVNKQSVSIIYPGNPTSFVFANIESGQKVVTKGVHRLANRVAVIEENTVDTVNNLSDLQQSQQDFSVGASQ